MPQVQVLSPRPKNRVSILDALFFYIAGLEYMALKIKPEGRGFSGERYSIPFDSKRKALSLKPITREVRFVLLLLFLSLQQRKNPRFDRGK